MTTAASLERDSDTVGTLAGAPGFEPGITGPKPVALPLGHAPVNRDAECTRTPGHTGSTRSAFNGPPTRSPAVEQQHRQRDRSENDHTDECEQTDEHDPDRDENDDELGDRRNP